MDQETKIEISEINCEINLLRIFIAVIYDLSSGGCTEIEYYKISDLLKILNERIIALKAKPRQLTKNLGI